MDALHGSDLHPLLFVLLTADIPSLFPNNLVTGHLLPDDVQPCVRGPPSAQLLPASQTDALSQDLHISNRPSLNFFKIQLIWFGTSQQLQKLERALLSERYLLLSLH